MKEKNKTGNDNLVMKIKQALELREHLNNLTEYVGYERPWRPDDTLKHKIRRLEERIRELEQGEVMIFDKADVPKRVGLNRWANMLMDYLCLEYQPPSKIRDFLRKKK